MKTELRKRVQLTGFEESITDQAAAVEMTMASIVKKIERGQMPQLSVNTFYGEQPKVKNLQDVFDVAEKARYLYDLLPSEIKKGMGNDYKNLESFINDPKNKELLQKYELLEPEKVDPQLETLRSIDKKLDPKKEAPKPS